MRKLACGCTCEYFSSSLTHSSPPGLAADTCDRLVQKHIKRQIVSLEGGIQVIADLNAYYNFIAGLKLPHLLQEFANLKMLGHVFVVADAKDLATIVRDVTRYGGSFKPEVSFHST